MSVPVARTGSPDAAPLSPDKPEGMSTESTGVPSGTGGAWYSPRNPVPNAASITRSHTGSASVDPDGGGSISLTLAPPRRNTEAATLPSAPLLPFPATTTTRRP